MAYNIWMEHEQRKENMNVNLHKQELESTSLISM